MAQGQESKGPSKLSPTQREVVDSAWAQHLLKRVQEKGEGALTHKELRFLSDRKSLNTNDSSRNLEVEIHKALEAIEIAKKYFENKYNLPIDMVLLSVQGTQSPKMYHFEISILDLQAIEFLKTTEDFIVYVPGKVLTVEELANEILKSLTGDSIAAT